MSFTVLNLSNQPSFNPSGGATKIGVYQDDGTGNFVLVNADISDLQTVVGRVASVYSPDLLTLVASGVSDGFKTSDSHKRYLSVRQDKGDGNAIKMTFPNNKEGSLTIKLDIKLPYGGSARESSYTYLLKYYSFPSSGLSQLSKHITRDEQTGDSEMSVYLEDNGDDTSSIVIRTGNVSDIVLNAECVTTSRFSAQLSCNDVVISKDHTESSTFSADRSTYVENLVSVSNNAAGTNLQTDGDVSFSKTGTGNYQYTFNNATSIISAVAGLNVAGEAGYSIGAVISGNTVTVIPNSGGQEDDIAHSLTVKIS